MVKEALQKKTGKLFAPLLTDKPGTFLFTQNIDLHINSLRVESKELSFLFT